MKKNIWMLFSLALLLSACVEKSYDIPPFIDESESNGAAPDPDPDPDPEPEPDPIYLFKEEFDGKISETKWKHCDWNVAPWQDFMGEFTFPEPKTPDRIIPVDATSVLLQAVDPMKYGLEEDKHHPWCMGLWTKGIFGFKHGEVRVRAKFKVGQGAWPAIWLMPTDEDEVEWPGGGEIDIMERWNDDDEVVHSVHYKTEGGGNTYKTWSVFDGESDLDLADYNEYGVRKTPGKLEYMVNGEVTFTVTQEEVEADGGIWPFEDHDYYVIINMACSPTKEHWNVGAYRSPLPSMDVLPYEMAVDYVWVTAIQ